MGKKNVDVGLGERQRIPPCSNGIKQGEQKKQSLELEYLTKLRTLKKE